MEIDLTVCIPTYNGIRWLPVVLDGLANYHYTGLTNINILVLDNGSKDGTLEYLETVIKNKWYHKLSIFLFKEPQRQGGVEGNIPFVRKRLAELVQTEYMMYLNQDILIEPFAIIDLFKKFISKKKCGAMAIKYDPVIDHIESGATIMRAEHGKQIEWGYVGKKCDCWFLKEGIEKLGLTMEYAEGMYARHVKYR